jgi:serine/threonine protein kinase
MYNMDKVIAHGTFGVVYECTSNQDKHSKKVALKRVFQDARYKNRELEVLLDLNRLESGQLVTEVHPNILDCI